MFAVDEPKNPAAQGAAVGETEPATQKKPRAHAPSHVGAELLADAPKKPAAQSEKLVEPSGQKWPAPQIVFTPSGQKKPAGHGTGR